MCMDTKQDKSKKIDETKYLEGNYSSDTILSLGERWEDAKQSKELADLEAYFTDYMAYLKENRKKNHYLVNEAILTCTHCTQKTVEAEGMEFQVPEGCTETKLKVTRNETAKNGAEQCFATIEDSEKGVNIFSFGNCVNPPDRKDEKKALIYAGMSEELRKLGTCQYLMKLNDKWENLIFDLGYDGRVENEDGSMVETITMESVLFCKHGGFIYPIDPGYIETESDLEDEKEPPEREKVSPEEIKIKAQLLEAGVKDPDVAIYVWKFFIDKGLSEYAVAGIMGNVFQESRFDSTANRNNNYLGLFQVGGERKERLKSEAGEVGWEDYRVQCEFTWKEYTGEYVDGWVANKLFVNDHILIGNKDDFENTKSATEAALIWGISYERALVLDEKTIIDGDTVFLQLQEGEKREQMAEKFYAILAGKEF